MKETGHRGLVRLGKQRNVLAELELAESDLDGVHGTCGLTQCDTDAAHAVHDDRLTPDQAEDVAFRTHVDASTTSHAEGGVDVGRLTGRLGETETLGLFEALGVERVATVERPRVGQEDGDRDHARASPDQHVGRHQHQGTPPAWQASQRPSRGRKRVQAPSESALCG